MNKAQEKRKEQREKSASAKPNMGIMYHSQNDDLVVTDTDYLDSLGNQDPLIECAIELEAKGYSGIVVHPAKLSNSKFFFGINYHMDTPEGHIYHKVQTAFHKFGITPDIEQVIKEIEDEYLLIAEAQDDY